MRFKKKVLRQRQSISHNVIPAVLVQKLNLLEKNKYLSDVLETNYLTVAKTRQLVYLKMGNNQL